MKITTKAGKEKTSKSGGSDGGTRRPGPQSPAGAGGGSRRPEQNSPAGGEGRETPPGPHPPAKTRRKKLGQPRAQCSPTARASVGKKARSGRIDADDSSDDDEESDDEEATKPIKRRSRRRAGDTAADLGSEGGRRKPPTGTKFASGGERRETPPGSTFAREDAEQKIGAATGVAVEKTRVTTEGRRRRGWARLPTRVAYAKGRVRAPRKVPAPRKGVVANNGHRRK